MYCFGKALQVTWDHRTHFFFISKLIVTHVVISNVVVTNVVVAKVIYL